MALGKAACLRLGEATCSYNSTLGESLSHQSCSLQAHTDLAGHNTLCVACAASCMESRHDSLTMRYTPPSSTQRRASSPWQVPSPSPTCLIAMLR